MAAPTPPPPPTSDDAEQASLPARAWRKYRSWPMWAQIAAAVVMLFIVVGAASGGGAEDQDAATEETSESEVDEAETTSTTDETTTTTEATTTTTTAAPTTTTQPPPPEPIVLEGSGDDVRPVSITHPVYAAMSHQGSANFIVMVNDSDGELQGGLANTIGDYTGEKVLDSWQDAGFIEVNADGPWRIELHALETAPSVDMAAGFQGTGDAVRRVAMDGATSMQLTHDGQGNFIVMAYSDEADLVGGLVNEIGPYEGTVLARPMYVLDIHADGNWSFAPT